MGKKKEEARKEEYQKEYSTISNMIYTMKGAFKAQKSVAIFLLIDVLAVSFAAYLPSFLIKFVIVDVENKVEQNHTVITIIVWCFILLVAKCLNTFTTNNIQWKLFVCRLSFMFKRIRKVLDMDFEYLESPKVRDLCHKAERATGGNTNGVEGMMHSFHNVMITLVKIIIAMGILITLNPWLILLILVFGVGIYLNMDITKRNDKKFSWNPSTPYWRKQYYMETTTTNFTYGKDIRLFSMKNWLLKKYVGIHDEMHAYMVGSKNRWRTSWIINAGITLIEEIIIYTYLINQVLYHGMTIDNFVFYFGAIGTFFVTMYSVFNNITDMRGQSREVNDFRSFLEFTDGDIKQVKSPIPKAKRYEFTFDHVSFCYPETEKMVLKDVCIKLAPGERLAVVGLNGAGKTTFIKLLSGLYRPTQGKILCNGIDITEFDRKEYYELFAPVFQNIELFAFSIAENVSMKTPEETKEDVATECLKLAGLGDKIEQLPKKGKTELLKVIYEEGIDLSGGEKQKLALARALYKDAPVIILDEPTSALDALAEYELYQKFDELIHDKTAIYISHRLSSTRFCNHIALFADGELIEYGTHETLLAAGKEYTKMFEVQAQYYQEGGREDE